MEQRLQFYATQLNKGIADKHASILVVAGGKNDVLMLRTLGFTNAVISNIMPAANLSLLLIPINRKMPQGFHLPIIVLTMLLFRQHYTIFTLLMQDCLKYTGLHEKGHLYLKPLITC
jgi:hypothetical protein